MQQLKPLTLRRNFSWTFIGNAIYATCQWGMLVVMAKLGSPEILGQFTLGLAITAPVMLFTNLHLRSVQATDARHQYVFGDYLGLRLISTVLALLMIALITLSAGYRWQTSLVILLIGLAKAFESISDVFYGLIQQHERMDRIAISLMIKGSLSLLLLGFGVYISGNLLWGVAGLVVAWGMVLFIYDIGSGALILNQTPQARCHLRTLTKLVSLSIPLGFVMMLISLNTNIPRYFIEQILGERELGIFAALAYLMVVGGMVVNALGESASPRLAKYYAVGDSTAFCQLLFKLVGIAAILGLTVVLIAIVAGRQILTLLYRPEYAEQANLFVWLMVAAGIRYISSFLGYGMTAARYFRIQIPLFVVVTSISAMTCFWLVPKQGLLGAAIALNISAVVQLGFSLAIVIYALHRLKNNSENNHAIY
ncbi:MAG: oligosaccharide flippase family protein [Pelatocladus maniniholoensis HA4357-MV3]|jgi:O-antigen/teichoic acid export membrane protein|uniref:Oligosaccharide flippase family protein n=1 Tax=Pelatocladus maniniholoensis HA4357-MV3 TaxID=1117104 RepID=A0A9E3HA75_9NOST|nr:oligosaccharide flippase family protein [Pelatocladus maniniholoensis HA4357-MV3]BAZ68532.1 polysaccharide biosynthesis protein [Fischerella sp. NIES-4106]